MKGWIRITMVAFVLVGGTAFFGFWSISQLGKTIDNLSAVYLANTPLVDSLLKHRQNRELASSSPEASDQLFATSTATSTDIRLASSSPEASGLFATSTDTELAFTFPQKEGGVYIGCTYPISWQSPETISSLEAALVDAGTIETVGENIGGLTKVNIIEKGHRNLDWKVGSVWPGLYYIKISKINGADTEIRSKAFIINKILESVSIGEQGNICKESGGSF